MGSTIEYIGFEVGNCNIIEDILQKKHLNELEEFLNKAGIDCKLKSIELY